MKLEKEIKIIDYGLGQNNTVIELETLSQFNDVEFIAFNEILKSKKIKLTLEVEEPILDDTERKYLSGVIRPFRDRIIYITKEKIFSNIRHIEILTNSITGINSEEIKLPSFWEGTMYKGMELNKKYTLEELGL